MEKYFCGLTECALAEMGQKLQVRHYKKGQPIFSSGDPADGIFCVQSGKVKILRTAGPDQVVLVDLKSQGDLFGHLHLFNSDIFITTAIALEDSTIHFLEKESVLASLTKSSEFSIQFIKKLSQDLNQIEVRIASCLSKNIKERLADLLLRLGNKYGVETDAGLMIDIKLTREEIASMLGTANETITRFFTEFKNDKLIEEKDKYIYILQSQKLNVIAHN